MRTKILTAAEMKAVDQNAVSLGMSPLQLMENAGSAVADAVLSGFKSSGDFETVWFFAGLGNNGGDTFVAARRLADKNISSVVFLLGSADKIKTAESAANYALLKKVSSVAVVEIADISELSAAIQAFSNPVCVVDGIFGTGFSGHSKGLEKAAIEEINHLKAQSLDIFVLSVDLPSGLSVENSGLAHETIVEADATVTFHKMKSFLEDAASAGKIHVAPIGIPDSAENFVGTGDLSLLFRRSRLSKKGDSGKVLIIAGGAYAGAPALAGMAAFRIGADIVTIAAPDSVYGAVSSFAPELIVKKLKGDILSDDDVPFLTELIEAHDSVVIGPGFGTAPESLAAAAKLIPYMRKAVIDADALRPEILEALKSANPAFDFILTPHYNEFLRIASHCGIGLLPNRADISAEELENAVAIVSRQLNAVLLLKGPIDLISNGRIEESRYNAAGNAGMSVGGTGDVLAGIVGGLLSKNAPSLSACCGAFICGSAGDSAFSTKGNSLIPSDILEKIPSVFGIKSRKSEKSGRK